jgi:hypothetical protein
MFRTGKLFHLTRVDGIDGYGMTTLFQSSFTMARLSRTRGFPSHRGRRYGTMMPARMENLHQPSVKKFHPLRSTPFHRLVC